MAMYYMGCGSATSKKTGNPFYTVSILRVNHFGSWEIKTLFCQKSTFDTVVNQRIPIGYGCIVQTGIDGELTSIQTDDNVTPLELEDNG